VQDFLLAISVHFCSTSVLGAATCTSCPFLAAGVAQWCVSGDWRGAVTSHEPAGPQAGGSTALLTPTRPSGEHTLAAGAETTNLMARKHVV
jgi:hypothetical protein